MRFPDLKSREAYAIILNICKTDERAEEQMLKKWYAKLLVLLAVVCAVAAAHPAAQAEAIPEETEQTLQEHEDGLTWVHTGDLGAMDQDGFVYFKQRIKRMIVTSGYNVYPSQLENVFDAHELVQMSCVIGVPDALKIQKVKAFIMLKPGVVASQETKDELMAYARKHIAKYALPYDIEFRAELPKTLVGKVAYRELEEEELGKLAAAGAAK